jgi:hypothetical protein
MCVCPGVYGNACQICGRSTLQLLQSLPQPTSQMQALIMRGNVVQ